MYTKQVISKKTTEYHTITFAVGGTSNELVDDVKKLPKDIKCAKVSSAPSGFTLTFIEEKLK